MNAVRESLHGRLRAATGPAHEALERDLDWRARVATLPGYRDLLGRLYGFHAAWEPAIGVALADPAFFDPRRRLPLLADDLGRLGLSAAAVAALPSPVPPTLDGPAAAMGALYVLEGSTLGGQLIGRHIESLYGLGEVGLAYYRAHGPDTGTMWRAFRTRLEGFSATDAAVVAAATGTFDALRLWLGSGSVHAAPDVVGSENDMTERADAI